MNETFARLNQRSALAFLLLAVIGAAVSMFLLKKADSVIAEIEALQIAPVFVARREFSGESDFLVVKKWKTYRNDEYGFEMRYPEDFVEIKSSAEFSAGGGRAYREVFINIIPPVVSFPEYRDSLAYVRAKRIREGRIVVLEKGDQFVAGRPAFREYIYERSLAAFLIRTSIDVTPRAIISVTVRQSGGFTGASAPSELEAMNEQILSTFRRIPK